MEIFDLPVQVFWGNRETLALVIFEYMTVVAVGLGIMELALTSVEGFNAGDPLPKVLMQRWTPIFVMQGFWWSYLGLLGMIPAWGQELGYMVSGWETISGGSVVEQGVDFGAALYDSMDWVPPVTMAGMVTLGVPLLVIGFFGYLGVYIGMWQIEMSILFIVGPFFVALGQCRWGEGFFRVYLSDAFSLFVRLFMAHLIISIGANLMPLIMARVWAAETGTLKLMVSAAVASVVFVIVAKNLPIKYGERVASQLSLSFPKVFAEGR